jgi:hypothetical protein
MPPGSAPIERRAHHALEVSRSAMQGGLGNAQGLRCGPKRAEINDGQVGANLRRRETSRKQPYVQLSGDADPRFLNSPLGLLQHALDSPMQDAARPGRCRSAGAAIKQPAVELAFQFVQGVGHRRLRQADVPRGSTGRACADHGVKNGQSTERRKSRFQLNGHGLLSIDLAKIYGRCRGFYGSAFRCKP